MSNFALFYFSFIFVFQSCFGDDCPSDCAQYVYDGCNECLCDSNGQTYNCTTNQCSDFQDPYCSLCNNNLQWTTCGTCITTCETVDLDLDCITECEDQCQCPSDYPIYHNGECIQKMQCPQYIIQTTKNTLETTNSNTNNNNNTNSNTDIKTTSSNSNNNTQKESTLLPIETNTNTIETTNSVSNINTPHSSYTNTAIISTKSQNNNDNNQNTNNVIQIVYATNNTNNTNVIIKSNTTSNNTDNHDNLFSSANVNSRVFIFIVMIFMMIMM